MTDQSLIPELDTLLHEPARLRILALLATVDRADFMYLLRATSLSRGNLSVQLGRLQEAGIVELERELAGARARTAYFLTDTGRKQLRNYRDTVLSLVNSF